MGGRGIGRPVDASIVASLANPTKVFNTLVLGLPRLAAGKLAHRGVARGQNHPAGLHPQGLRGNGDRILVVLCPMDMIPARLLAVVAPKRLQPFPRQRHRAIARNHGQRSPPTQPPLLQMLGLGGVERILLADAVEVGTVVGAEDGASLRAVAVAARLGHSSRPVNNTES